MNIVSLFNNSVTLYKNKDALRAKYNNEYRSITYNQLKEKVGILANYFISKNIQKGDKIGILSFNCPEWVISDLAILSINAINVPISPILGINQIKYILEETEVKILIVNSVELLEKINNYNLPSLKEVILINSKQLNSSNNYNFKLTYLEDILNNTSFKLNNTININEEDIATIIYTSGTTGEPKGVVLTHKNIVSNALAVIDVLKIDSSFIELAYLPLSHVFARTFYYMLLFKGGTIVYSEGVDKVIQNLQEVKPNFFITVPRLLEKIYSLAKSKNFTKLELQNLLGGNLKLIICGGAALKKEIGEYFFENDIKVAEGYGLTETSPVISVNPPDNIKYGTVGPCINGVQVKISNEGEILCKGPNVMKEYYKKPKETLEVFDNEGWFHTGDIGTIDSEGYITLIDRKKDIIVTSTGKKVPPTPIENKIKESKFIEHVVLIGDGYPYITALVVPERENLLEYAKVNNLSLDYNELIKEEDIYQLLFKEITDLTQDFEPNLIKKITILPQTFSIEKNELTSTLKYRRKNIINNYSDLIKQMYLGK